MTGFITEEKALSIVSKRRVLSARSIIDSWNRVIREKRTDHGFHSISLPKEIPLFYYEKTIRSVLEKPMWRLIFDPGISLRSMRVIFGSDNKKQPSHQFGNKWWFLDRDCVWTKKRGESGYYLVKIRIDFCNMKWTDQELSMTKMGEKFVRAPHRLMVSLSASYFLIHGVYPFEGFSHWGSKMNPGELDICAIRVGPKGFTLYRWNRYCPNRDLGVCIIRKYDSF